MSGYLFFISFKEWSWTKYLDKLKRRVHSLLIPYLLWNLIFILISILKTFYNRGWNADAVGRISGWYHAKGGIIHMLWDCQTIGSARTDMLGFQYYSKTPVNVSLWFLRDLMVVCIFAPIIYWLLRKLPIPTLILLLVCLYSNVWIHVTGFSISCAFYFCLGAAFAVSGRDMVQSFAKFRSLSLICALSLSIYSIYYWKQSHVWLPALNTVQDVVSVIATFNVASWLVEHGFSAPSLWSKGSFFVYVTHSLFIFLLWSPLSISIKILNRVLPDSNPICHLLQFLLVPVLTACICLSIYWLLKRFLPRTCALLMGSR